MRIGFIAMSGIRACDTELLELGLTLPGFVERSKAIASLPSLGLLTLAGMTPKHYERRYYEVEQIGQMATIPNDLDLVALSSLSAQIHEAYRLAERFHAAGIPVVMGGLHITSCPDEPARHGAIPVIGEGEVVWPEILADAEAGTLKGRYDARGREFDLARSPMPAYELLEMGRYNRITVQTSRGCPWRCSFCASSILLTGGYKQKPVERVLAEIERIRELWPHPFIELADDNSFVNRLYWRRLLPELAKRKIRWFTESDLSIYQDEGLLQQMRDAGCVEVLIGLESPTGSGLDQIELKCDWKRGQVDHYREAIARIQAAGVRVNACFVVGLDGQSPEVFGQILEMVEETLPFDVQVTLPTPFPGTPFYRQLAAQGRLLEPEAWERCTLFDLNFEPLGMSAVELRTGFHRLVEQLYSDTATQRRKRHFHRLVRRERRRSNTTLSRVAIPPVRIPAIEQNR